MTHCLKESLKRIDQFEIFNLADDTPSNMQDVVEYICKKVNIKLPNTINYEQLENEITKNFFTDNKKVLNTKIKQKLNFKLKYPSYKEGYNQIINSMTLEHYPLMLVMMKMKMMKMNIVFEKKHMKKFNLKNKNYYLN